MEHDLNRRQIVPSRVCGSTLCHLDEYVVRNFPGAPTPALVSCLVHITVITRQITPAVHLEDKLIERYERYAHDRFRVLDCRLETRLARSYRPRIDGRRARGGWRGLLRLPRSQI